ncbi:MAG TPA: DUF5362 family protein [Chitinophagaceae bacterium]|nr:DUF5362 family protein [Chitinophagaceae bacterium]
MEQQNQNQESPLFGLTIDPVIKSHLSETARWGKFLSIIGFICCFLIVIGGIFLVTAFNSVDRNYGFSENAALSNMGPAIAVVYIIIAVLYFFPCLFLLRFSNKMKTALAADNQEELAVSFQNLKVLFRYVGILTIIVLSIYLLAFVFGGLGMLMSR